MNRTAISGVETALAALKAERNDVEAAIKGLETALARMSRESQGGTELASSSRALPGLGAYSKKGATETIKGILIEMGEPLTSREILELATSQGFATASGNAANMFRSICERLVKKGILERADRQGKRGYKIGPQ